MFETCCKACLKHAVKHVCDYSRASNASTKTYTSLSALVPAPMLGSAGKHVLVGVGGERVAQRCRGDISGWEMVEWGGAGIRPKGVLSGAGAHSISNLQPGSPIWASWL